MATMNFSLPDTLKARFDAAFVGENKSAVLAGLVDQAIERKQIESRRKEVLARVRAWQVESSNLQPSSSTTDELRKYRNERINQPIGESSQVTAPIAAAT
jgi:hypothetical protein